MAKALQQSIFILQIFYKIKKLSPYLVIIFSWTDLHTIYLHSSNIPSNIPSTSSSTFLLRLVSPQLRLSEEACANTYSRISAADLDLNSISNLGIILYFSILSSSVKNCFRLNISVPFSLCHGRTLFCTTIIFLNESYIFNNGRSSCAILSSSGTAYADWI